jgi:hypothetical protein
MVMRDNHYIAFHDRGKSAPMLCLEFPKIPTPDKNPIMVQAKEVVRFFCGPGYENILPVYARCGRCKAIELMMRVNLRRESFLPKFFSRLGI